MRDPDAAIPFVPVWYSEADIRLADIMAGRNAEAGIRIGSLPARIRLFWEPYGKGAFVPVLALRIRGKLWQVSLAETRYFYDLLEAADANGLFKEAPAESLPREILWAIMESFLGPELSRIEATMGAAVDLAEPDPDVKGLELPFSIRFQDDREVPGRLSLPEDGLDLLEKMVAGHGRNTFSPDKIRTLEKRVPVVAGTLTLGPKEVSGLEPGDVLLPDLWLPDQGRLALGFKPDWLFCAMDTEAMTLIPEGLQQPGPFTYDNLKSKDNHPMEKEEKETPEENLGGKPEEVPAEDVRDISTDLELPLVFEVGRTAMTVAKIAELAQGQTIRLPARPGEGVGVDIRINDRVVARGRIVSVGQDTGVQITGIGA